MFNYILFGCLMIAIVKCSVSSFQTFFVQVIKLRNKLHQHRCFIENISFNIPLCWRLFRKLHVKRDNIPYIFLYAARIFFQKMSLKINVYVIHSYSRFHRMYTDICIFSHLSKLEAAGQKFCFFKFMKP